MMKNNYYEILEVLPTASNAEIKRAYYRLAKKYHPDINSNTANLFKIINTAYEALSNPIFRREYDIKLKEEDDILSTKIDENSELWTKAAKAFDDLNKTLDDEDFGFDYFKNNEYYQHPKKEPLFKIISNFEKYRFENAIASIFARNILTILGVWIIYSIASVGIICTKNISFLHKKIDPKKNILYKILYKNKALETFGWTTLLSMLIVSKLMYSITYSLYWIFKNIIRYLLLPLAILIGISARWVLIGR